MRNKRRGVSSAVAAAVLVVVLVLAVLAYEVVGVSGETTTVTTTSIPSASTFTTTTTSTATPTNQIVPLRVFAAASFTPALQAVQSAYQLNNSVSLIFNFASSGSLETQIAQGSPADVFMSADANNNIKLQTASLLANGNTYQSLIYNHIEMFVPANNPKNITTLADLLRPGVRVAIGAPASVPAGAYTQTVWNNIGARWGNASSPDFKSSAYANYAQAMSSHVVTQATDVESAITAVLTGAADAAFGYTSDGVANAAQLKAITIPADVNVQAVYTISVIKTSQHQAQANAFVTWLLSPSGQAYLQKWGFTPLSGS